MYDSIVRLPLFGLALVVCLGILGCKNPTVPKAEINTDAPSIMVIADPQIHNVYGVGVKQMSDGANKVARVAIRPPELNLLAPIVLHDLVRRMQEKAPDQRQEVLLGLGDMMNIACSGEFDLFLRSLTNGFHGRPILLLAHGNHDTYLMGTVNSYFPPSHDWSRPTRMEGSSVPVDEQWWGTPTFPLPGNESNWRDACYECTNPNSTPMNKARWLAMYLATLEQDGLLVTNTKPASDAVQIPISYTARPGSRLAAMNYRAEGYWVRPRAVSSPMDISLRSVYDSYIVQQVDLGNNHRLFIIDTSVINFAGGGFPFLKNNAGSKASIGEYQMRTLETLLRKTPSGMRITLAGHFPLNDLDKEERKTLLKHLESFSGWNYLSGHTHYSKGPHRGFNWGEGHEINVASTTDWPMAANRIFLAKTPGMHSALAFTNGGSWKIDYSPARVRKLPELCRHLPAAEKIAKWEINSAGTNQPWKSPPPCDNCELSLAWKTKHVELNEDARKRLERAWKAKGEQLANARKKIESRYANKNEQGYRDFILSLAAAASEAESKQYGLADLFTIP